MEKVTFKAEYWRDFVLIICSLGLMAVYCVIANLYETSSAWIWGYVALFLVNLLVSVLCVFRAEQVKSEFWVWVGMVVLWFLVFIYEGDALGHLKIGQESIGGAINFNVLLLGTAFIGLCGLQLQECVSFTRQEVEKRAKSEKGGGIILTFPWISNIAEKVEDFTEPRYVYEDGYESIEPSSEHGKVVGYRLSEDFVVSFYWIEDEIGRGLLICKNFKNSLDFGASRILRKNISSINLMRKKIGKPEIRI